MEPWDAAMPPDPRSARAAQPPAVCGRAAHRAFAALRRTPVATWNVSDWAAALTYYAVLALLPALLLDQGGRPLVEVTPGTCA